MRSVAPGEAVRELGLEVPTAPLACGLAGAGTFVARRSAPGTDRVGRNYGGAAKAVRRYRDVSPIRSLCAMPAQDANVLISPAGERNTIDEAPLL